MSMEAAEQADFTDFVGYRTALFTYGLLEKEVALKVRENGELGDAIDGLSHLELAHAQMIDESWDENTMRSNAVIINMLRVRALNGDDKVINMLADYKNAAKSDPTDMNKSGPQEDISFNEAYAYFLFDSMARLNLASSANNTAATS